MSKIYAKMFGTPIITKDDKEVLFPYSKVKALLYYLIINKRASRDELSGLLWCEDREEIAKKNLRNAIYKIKKSFDEDVLISPNKSLVMINPNLDISSNVEPFINGDDSLIDEYIGDFIQGFYVKNAEPFEQWLTQIRENYREIFVRKLYELIDKSIHNQENSKIELYCKKLISVNEFDEKAYAILINHYKDIKDYKSAIDTYNKLSKILSVELGITPDEQTTVLFNQVLDLINDSNYNKKSQSEKFFYGRISELRLLEQNFDKFIKNDDAKSIILSGEAGIGKSRLKDEFLSKINSEKSYVFETNCYPAEKEYFFKPWNPIISKMSEILIKDNINIPHIWENIISCIFPEFNKNKNTPYQHLPENFETIKYDMIGDILSDILERITKHKKVMLIFEDIQYADSMSISILSSIILHQKKSDIIFIATYRNEYDKNVDKLITSMNLHDKLILMPLDRFTSEEAEKFVKQAYPNYTPTKELLKKIYQETEGNTFFLTEYVNILKSNGDINIMSVKMQDIIKSKFLYLSEESKKILNIASLFFDEVPLKLLKDITGHDELELMDIIEELENKFILTETQNEDSISFKFTHQKLREFIYMKQSDGRKKLLHAKIGSILEQSIKNDKINIDIYHKLIYHYTNADNKSKALIYKIKILNYYLNFSHELFPILNQADMDAYRYENFSKQQTLSHFKDIENTLKQVRKKGGNSEEIIKLEIAFLHMKGRYLIRDGDYEQGIKLIQDMITQSLDIEDRDYTIEGYKQMIFYCIQTNQPDIMLKYIELALNLAVECNYHKETGIILRLKGLYKIMCQEYEEAEKLLNESINTFKITKQVANKYALNIAAAYNYIGEIRRFNMEFDEAVYYYEQAIKICESKSAFISLAIFNINAGQATFDMGDYQKSTEYFEKALNLYSKLDSIWRKSIAEAFMALILNNEENYSEALKYLKNADTHSQKIKNPHEIGVVFRVKAQIRADMLKNKNLNKVYSKYLDNDLEYYCAESIKYLTTAGDKYEINVINNIMK
ncbi:bacterial transcriptional activator domain protein [Peptoanaerobacter stomatis]|uniref:Bacterial transcriptional activator domain protein n=1 Tax=Peptoanaerobacter stomatis TaxID=796937 RepID=J5USI0_9FIRM|nr:AAA family ATPase [Peptoanaerobacter stomatis]EJU24774.1 bacterial transcriptional activator domain protein [Peptoanaerobacter stomatis]NWO26037.1 AAA family ATPase [Peptostreptococcaceae bacterium oral taxon 081]